MQRVLASLFSILVLAILTNPCVAGALTSIADGQEGEPTLPAYLARPPGHGPFPAVVVLHGCGGFGSVPVSWADRLARWGYVALAPDSLTPHGRTTGCRSGAPEQAHDALRALDFLASQSFVRRDRIALLGISWGGGAALAAFERGGIAQGHAREFRSAVAFYPPCAGSNGLMMGPTLILVGERDDWTPADDCRDLAAGKSGYGLSRTRGDRSMVELVVYPDTYHSFLAPHYTSGALFLGHWLQYSESATSDARRRVQAFLRRTLAE